MNEIQQKLEELRSNGGVILEEIAKLEPSQTDVFSTYSSEIKVVYENSDFSLSSSSATSMYGIRSIMGGRVGFMTTNANDPTALKQVARDTQGIARLAPASPHQQIAPGPGKIGHYDHFDPHLLDLPPKDLYAFAEQVVAEARKDARVSIDRAEISWSLSAWLLMSSNGYQQSATATSCSWSCMGMAKTANEVTSFDYDGDTVAAKNEVEKAIALSIGRFRESVVGSLGSRKGKTYKGKVLLHPSAVMDLIGGTIEANCTGIRHQDGMSSWAGKVGQEVVSPSLHVFEDPLDRSRIDGWSPFDREGVPTGRHDLIQEGRLSYVAHNCFSAHRSGVAPTGNAAGGSRSLPGIGFFNLTVEGSKKARLMSDDELVRELNDGLVLKRFSGNEDAISGQFSGVAKNSWWVEKGARAYAVSEVMVAGNLFDAANAVVAVGRTLHPVLGGGQAPYILIDGVSVTSG